MSCSFNVRVHRPSGHEDYATMAVKQYQLCGCVLFNDLFKTIKQDFLIVLEPFNVYYGDKTPLGTQYLDEILPPFGAVLDVYYG